MEHESWSNVGGCSWKNPFNKEKRAECEDVFMKKQASSAKGVGAQADLLLAQAALESQKKVDTGWSPLAVTGVVMGSLLGIALMVVIIKKAKS